MCLPRSSSESLYTVSLAFLSLCYRVSLIMIQPAFCPGCHEMTQYFISPQNLGHLKEKKIKEFFCIFCDCIKKVKSSKLYCHVTFGIVWLTLKKCNTYLTYSIKATTDDQFQYLMIYLFVCVHLLIQTWIATAAVSAGRPTAFPSQPRDIISPACPVSSSGSSLWQTCPKRLPREALRWWSSLSWGSTMWRSSSST